MDEYDNTLSPASSSSQSSSMAKPSCSHWWHGPFYIAMSLTLAYIAFTTTKHPRPETPLPPVHALAFNASRALRLHGGFHIFATLLQISPELFFSGSESTIFAIQDSSILNLTVTPWAMRQMLRYHASPSALPMAALMKKPPGYCFKTLVDDKNLVITKNDAESRSVTVNNVLISHPDLFVEGPLFVHGVLGPFDVYRFHPCNSSDQSPFLAPNSSDQMVQWNRIIRLLSSNGFVSFAIGLNSVLDGIIEEYRNLSSVSIFAPPNSGFISSSSPFLDNIVKIHILPHKFSYLELGAAQNLETLVPSYNLKIDKALNKLAINGVEITNPELFLSDNFVIHGISREFDDVELFSSSI